MHHPGVRGPWSIAGLTPLGWGLFLKPMGSLLNWIGLIERWGETGGCGTRGLCCAWWMSSLYFTVQPRDGVSEVGEGSSGGKLPVVPPFSLSSLHPLSVSCSWQGFVTHWCCHTSLCLGCFTSGGAFKWKYCCSAHVLPGSSWGVIKPNCHPCTQKPH